MNEQTETAENIESQSSPDFLDTTVKGNGVRRLNRLPLVLVGFLILLAVVAITYTFYQRQADMQKATEAAEEDQFVESVATAPIRPLGPDAVGMPLPPHESEFLGMENKPHAEQKDRTNPELEARQRILQRIEENKFSQLEAALGADVDVQKFSNLRSASSKQTDGSNPKDGLETSARVNSVDPMLTSLDMPGGFGETDQNRQDHKRAFLKDVSETAVYLNHTRMAPLSRYEVKASTIIPGVMISGVNSDLPGQIIGQVRANVYDTATGQHLLIPAGARLIGTYDSTVTMGQERVLIAWNRIIYPDGSSVSLDTMPGADVSGFAGFNDKVDNHYLRIFGNAFMLSLFSAGIQLSQPTQPRGSGIYDSQQIMAAELGRQLGRMGMEMTRRNLNIQPTLEIRPGYQFTVMITKDIILPPWEGHPMAAAQ